MIDCAVEVIHPDGQAVEYFGGQVESVEAALAILHTTFGLPVKKGFLLVCRDAATRAPVLVAIVKGAKPVKLAVYTADCAWFGGKVWDRAAVETMREKYWNLSSIPDHGVKFSAADTGVILSGLTDVLAPRVEPKGTNLLALAAENSGAPSLAVIPMIPLIERVFAAAVENGSRSADPSVSEAARNLVKHGLPVLEAAKDVVAGGDSDPSPPSNLMYLVWGSGQRPSGKPYGISISINLLLLLGWCLREPTATAGRATRCVIDTQSGLRSAVGMTDEEAHLVVGSALREYLTLPRLVYAAYLRKMTKL